jgi:hypothetical protein
MRTKLACVAGLALALSGCASTLLSDDRLRDNTAGVLGQSPVAVVITDRKYDGFNVTYYTARTPRGVFTCQQEGGTVFDAGLTSHPPTCSR